MQKYCSLWAGRRVLFSLSSSRSIIEKRQSKERLREKEKPLSYMQPINVQAVFHVSVMWEQFQCEMLQFACSGEKNSETSAKSVQFLLSETQRKCAGSSAYLLKITYPYMLDFILYSEYLASIYHRCWGLWSVFYVHHTYISLSFILAYFEHFKVYKVAVQVKGPVHPHMKIQSSSVHPHADGKCGEVW